MRTLDIKYGRGSMRIDVDTFFPTSKPRIRKLLKIMRLDLETDRVPELLQLLGERVEDVRLRISAGNTNAIVCKRRLEEAEKAVKNAKDNLDALKSAGVPKDLLESHKKTLRGLRKNEKEAKERYRNIVNEMRRDRREGIALLQDIEVIKNERGIDKT